jgi:hypothetical protein
MNPSCSNVFFTIPNMNQTLNIKLSNDNFTCWRTQIMAYIRGQDAYGFLDGTSRPPVQTISNTSTDAGAPVTMANLEFLTWCQRDQMILNMLISTLTEPLVVHAVGCATAHDLWATLVTMFASQERSRVMQIHYQLATPKEGNSSITEYKTIKTMSDNLAAAGQHLNDFESVSHLLAGLESEYDPIVPSVTTHLDPLSLDELYGHLLAHEMRIEHHLLIQMSNHSHQPILLYELYCPLHTMQAGHSSKLTFLMHFFMVSCLKTYIWLHHRALFTQPILTTFANCTRHYMG